MKIALSTLPPISFWNASLVVIAIACVYLLLLTFTLSLTWRVARLLLFLWLFQGE